MTILKPREEFTVHKLNAAGLAKATDIANVFSDALDKLDLLMPTPSRERALAITKLQEACFFAKRAVAIQPENQEA